ncbi:MAG: DUF296 domain-containing protein [Nitrososphaeria archaeon]
MKLLFKIETGRSEGRVEGDVAMINKKKSFKKFDSSFFASTLTEEKRTVMDFTSEGTSAMNALTRYLEENGFNQGYIKCSSGIVSDLRYAFFLTKHKPYPTFAYALLKGRNQVISLSGFFLPLRSQIDPTQKSIVPHLHIVFRSLEDGRVYSGHFVDAEKADLRIEVVQLSGGELKRDIDPNTGLMYLRARAAKKKRRNKENFLIFAVGQNESFPDELLKRIKSYNNVTSGEYEFAVGTLWSARLKNTEQEHIINPREGMELSYTEGEIVLEKEKTRHHTKVTLIDRFGRSHSGHLLSGRVKDLVEGVLKLRP